MRIREYFSIFLFALTFLAMAPAVAFGNNLDIANISLESQSTGNGTWDIEFDISWDNSWCESGAQCNGDAGNATNNWDAAWVFAKYSVYSGGVWGPWTHCKLKTSGHTEPSGSQIDTGTTDGVGMGVFIYRDGAGTGSNNWDNARIVWHYDADSVADDALLKVQVFGVEMVHVPEGSFYVGSGGTESGSFTDGSWVSGATIPFQITSEGAITIAASVGNLWGTSTSGNNTIGGAGTLPAAFPKGFAPFYMMKYEVTQKQYVDFLNTLTRDQQEARVADHATNSYYSMSGTEYVNYRSGIRNPASIPAAPGVVTFGCDLDGITTHNDTKGDGTFNESNDGQWVAANYLSWADLAAYADWAALRPFTELEYEKAARGPDSPSANVYAWGSASFDGDCPSYGLSGTTSGQADEDVDDNCNLNHTSNTVDGPYRGGIYAKAATTRAQAGAGYYGIMEFSGNLYERPVSVGEATVGRLFDGTHGNGALTAAGAADASTWPGTTATGSGRRGGSWKSGPPVGYRLSYRGLAAGVDSTRSSDYGGRLCRTSE
ncbi:MAG: SUMF1/EgtB/PvdO family nonheme iron enzyme [Elusimicrobia bacterium]|nr:SUMF1/EgtB/PvdO family nonheme iron enzyme [Elusimicrobiota bacterium]